MYLRLNKSVKQIMLLCDHSIETSLAVPSHGNNFFSTLQNKIRTFCQIWTFATFNFHWSDVWLQRTRAKRWIGAQIVLKNSIKNKEVETLPAGSGGTGNPVPVVSGSWVGNGEPWTLGRVPASVCAVIEENKSWSAKSSKINCLFSQWILDHKERESQSPKQVKLNVMSHWLVTSFVTSISAELFSECHFSGKPHATTQVVFD